MEQGFVDQDEQGTRYRRNMVQILQQRELARTSQQMEKETGLTHIAHRSGERIDGIVKRAITVGDQRFAVIENSREFSLVPWRPVLERAIGKPVSGVMRDGPISWTIGGRGKGIEIG